MPIFASTVSGRCPLSTCHVQIRTSRLGIHDIYCTEAPRDEFFTEVATEILHITYT